MVYFNSVHEHTATHSQSFSRLVYKETCLQEFGQPIQTGTRILDYVLNDWNPYVLKYWMTETESSINLLYRI